MAKVKYGEMIADLRGKINGTVHSKNRAGQYMRNKTSPVNPQSTAQSSVRNSFATYAQGWRALTANQRAAWTGGVENFVRNNVFGDAVRMTGANLYMALNRVIATIGGTPISSPPVVSAPTGILTFTLVADVSDVTILATYTPAIPAAGTVQVWATAPVSAGISFVKNKFRYIGKMVTADASPFDISSMYEEKFGTGWLTPGQKIFVKLVPVVTLSGIAAPGLDASAIVIA